MAKKLVKVSEGTDGRKAHVRVIDEQPQIAPTVSSANLRIDKEKQISAFKETIGSYSKQMQKHSKKANKDAPVSLEVGYMDEKGDYHQSQSIHFHTMQEAAESFNEMFKNTVSPEAEGHYPVFFIEEKQNNLNRYLEIVPSDISYSKSGGNWACDNWYIDDDEEIEAAFLSLNHL